MAGASAKGSKTTSLINGQQFDTTTYGPMATGADAQPFWDDPIYENNDVNRPLGIIGDLYGSSAWDRVILQGQRLPGLWEATATPAVQIDVQKPNGFDGAALISRGYVPAGITITGRIWTPAQWLMFQRLIPTFWAPPNHIAVNDVKKQKGQIEGKQKSVKVDYPGLAALNIHWLVIKQITPPENTSEKGVRQIKIIAIEYVPEPQKLPSATKKIDGASNGKDRSVQAQIIGQGPNGYIYAPANSRKPPSKTQAHRT